MSFRDEAVTSIAIVCGYRELDTLDEYVAAIAPMLRSEQPAFAILSGGITTPALGVSEAEAMGDALEVLLPEQPFLLEDEAMTTLENLVNGRALAERTFGRITRWSVFCDTPHRKKVATLARLILGRGVTVYDVPRDCTFTTRLLEPATLAAEACAAMMPPLRPLVRSIAMWARGM